MTGFLGRNLLNKLCEYIDFNDIHTLGRRDFDFKNHHKVDLLDERLVEEEIKNISPELVFHCASCPLTKTNGSQNQIIYDNICTTNNLLIGLSKTDKCPRFIFPSSVTVYGYFDIDRPANWLTREKPISLYSMTKLACENLINIYTNQNYIRGISIRLPAMVGQYSTHGLLHDLLYKVNQDTEYIELIGKDPGSTKPYTDVSEVAEFLVKVGLDKPGFDYKKQSMVLAGHYESLSVKEVAEIVMQGLRIRKRIKWSGSSWPGDNPLINIDPDYVFKSSSSEAIEKVVGEWTSIHSNIKIS